MLIKYQFLHCLKGVFSLLTAGVLIGDLVNKLKHTTVHFNFNSAYFRTFDRIFKAAQWVKEEAPIIRFPNLIFVGIDNHFGHDHKIFWVPNKRH